MPTVSVILPAYEAEAYLAATLKDLLEQSFTDFEIVVVDDGSTDGTEQVASEYAKLDDRVKLLSLDQNVGVARARERAVRASRGDYLWFVDVDDRRSADALRVLVDTARENEADIVVCGAEYAYDDGSTRVIRPPHLASPISGRMAFRMLLDGAITGHLWNKLFRRSLTDSIEFTPARVHSDLAMVAQLLASARRVATVDDILYSYLLRSGSIIRSGTRRGDSLLIVGAAVRGVAESLDLRIPGSPEFRYFEVRFLLLSRMKDALLGPYDDRERTSAVRSIRRSITWRSIAVVAARGDFKRLLLALSAKVGPRLHRTVLAIAAERAVADPSQIG